MRADGGGRVSDRLGGVFGKEETAVPVDGVRSVALVVGWLAAAFLAGGVHGASAQGEPERSEPARVRLLAALPGVETVEVTFTSRGDAGEALRLELPYGRPSGYRRLTPARYEIEVRGASGLLARTTYGLGPGARYTLLVVGLADPSADPSPATLGARLRWIFGGAEGVSANGYLPQVRLLRDGKDVSSRRGHLRLVHGAPGAVALEARLDDGEQVRTLPPGLEHPPRASGGAPPPPPPPRLAGRGDGTDGASRARRPDHCGGGRGGRDGTPAGDRPTGRRGAVDHRPGPPEGGTR